MEGSLPKGGRYPCHTLGRLNFQDLNGEFQWDHLAEVERTRKARLRHRRGQGKGAVGAGTGRVGRRLHAVHRRRHRVEVPNTPAGYVSPFSAAFVLCLSLCPPNKYDDS